MVRRLGRPEMASRLGIRAIGARWSRQAWRPRKRVSTSLAVLPSHAVPQPLAGGFRDVISTPDRIRTCDLRFRSLAVGLVDRYLTPNPDARGARDASPVLLSRGCATAAERRRECRFAWKAIARLEKQPAACMVG